MSKPTLSSAPMWRREPYAVFFPLGIVLSWAGVGRWLAFAIGGDDQDYLSIYAFHGIAQIQGFLICFAIGFLFTMIPRRTGTWPPSVAEMVVAIIAPVSTVAAAWNGRWALSQVGWIVLCVLLVTFVLRRFLSGSAQRRPPPGFVWIPVALVLGLAGSVMTAVGGTPGSAWPGLHLLGQQLVLQGVFIALVLGVGSLALPMMTRGAAPADAVAGPRNLAVMVAHLIAAALLVASFLVQQQVSLAAGCGLRAAVITAELVFAIELWRLPSLPGWNRWVIWVAAWCLPLGFAFAAIFPAWYQAGLHISFVAGLATLTLAVSTHVILGHTGRGAVVSGRPWQIATIAALMLAATASRVAMSMQPLHRNAWMATAAFYFLAATLVWAWFLLPALLRRKD